MSADDEGKPVFKMPVLVGKIGQLPKKITSGKSDSSTPEESAESSDDVPKDAVATEKRQNVAVLSYKEPDWSDLPQSTGRNYSLEILKNGAIIDEVDLMSKPFWVFGRLADCDICLQHPTISRYHAVLQYRDDDDKEKCGFYIYDLESTHGTFLNKYRLKARNYQRVQVGHMLKLGCSTRMFILNGPSEDSETESSLTVTELKQQRAEQLQKQRDIAKMEEERGIDWGLGEDANEDSDLMENPYAETNNEELYLDNPKKTLRGFFEREGLELEYDCSEQGIGQFVCKVELPIDDEVGRPVFAEVTHRGKKKEAVIQCALEACRILDRHNLLRQATHEPHSKVQRKNWKDNDYYDSDDDTFLDRTGTIEKKREMRMVAKVQSAETYESLVAKEKDIRESIVKLEKELSEAQNLKSIDKTTEDNMDSLESFMLELNQSKPDKNSVKKMKAQLLKLKQEHVNVIKLANIAKPVDLPALIVPEDSVKVTLPTIGKRKKPLVKTAEKTEQVQNEDKRVDGEKPNSPTKKHKLDDSQSKIPNNSRNAILSNILDSLQLIRPNFEANADKFEKIVELTTKMQQSNGDFITEIELLLNELVGLNVENVELVASLQKVIQEVNELEDGVVRKQAKVMEKQDRGKKGRSQRKRGLQSRDASTVKKWEGGGTASGDYDMWVPPVDQSGDGRTSLNDKLGY